MNNISLHNSTHLTTKNRIPKILGLAANIAALGLFFPCASSFAQAIDSISTATPPSGNYVGIGAISVPKYQGSDQYEIRATPLLEYNFGNGIFIGGDNQSIVGYQFVESSKLKFGASLSVDSGRRKSHAVALAGMGNIDVKPTAVAFVKASLTDNILVNASVHYGSGNNQDGALLKLGTSYVMAFGPSSILSFNVGATLANDSYMQDYFGVNAGQARTSGYRIYTAKSGLRDSTGGVSFIHRLDSDWSLLAGINVTKLSNIAKDSPIVRTANTQSVFLGLAYSIK
jgi:outer membrane protein